MRFLHTSDWHVGKTLKGRSRLDEQRDVLREIVQIARAEQPDAVLIAGDLYDSAAPSAGAQRLVVDALMA
ncbi:MAG TPA: exonuclease subunit SbcD, partial [Pseudonocardia sp.]|nr:exonuclease subunit SbcD [Pseudonocardia sp.]